MYTKIYAIAPLDKRPGKIFKPIKYIPVMDMYYVRVGSSKKFYPKPALIFGIGHYVAVKSGEDDYSRNLIYFYKYGNNIGFFAEELKDLYKLRFEGDKIRFDYMTLYPTRKKDGLNQNMQNLINKLSMEINLPYRQILRRNRDILPNHELKTFEERIKNVQNSIDVMENVKDKNIIVIDNTSTTGISLIDAANLLLNKGSKEVACMCLGLSAKEKDKDWSDLNKTLKYSRIKEICMSPFVPPEAYKKWKKTSQN